MAVRSGGGRQAHLFPQSVTSHFAKAYGGPAVYRWAVFNASSQLAVVYFGEAEEFPRRVWSYLKPGPRQKTSIRIREFLVKGPARRSFSCASSLSDHGHEFTVSNLRSPPVRKMTENLLLTLERPAGVQILNRALIEKPTAQELRTIMKYVKTMSLDERRRLLNSQCSSLARNGGRV